MTRPDPPRHRRRRRAVVLGALALGLVFATVAAWFLVALESERVAAFATRRLTAALGRPVAVSDIEVSPLGREFVLRGVQLGREPLDSGPPPPSMSAEAIRARFSWQSLLRLRLHLDDLGIEGFAIRGFDDAGAPAPESPALERALEAVAGRLTISSDRMTLTGTTVGYRNRPTPWEVRADAVSLDFSASGSGDLDGRIRSGRGVVRLWEQPDLPMALVADIRVRGNQLHLDRVELRSDLVEVDFAGTLDLDDDLAGTLAMTGTGDAGGLGRVLFDFEGLDTEAEPWFRFDGEAGFQENGLSVDGEFVIPRGRFHGVPLSDFRGVAHWDPERIEILSSRGIVAGGPATLRLLQQQPREENPAVIVVTSEDGSFRAVAEGLFGVETTLESRLAVEADLRLPLAEPSLMTGTILARGELPEGVTRFVEKPRGDPDARGEPLPFAFTAELAMDDRETGIRNLVVEGRAFRAEGEGRYPRHGAADFAFRGLAGDAAEVDAWQQEARRVLFAEDPETTFWDVAGAGGASGTIRGRWPDLLIEGEVEGQMLRFSAIRTEALFAAGRIGRQTIWLDDLNARRGEGGRIRASGVFDRSDTVYPDMEFEAEWEEWDAEEIIAFLEWDLVAEGIASGRSDTVRRDERYTGGGSVTSTGGSILEQPFDELRIAWSMDGETARLAPMNASFRDGTAAGELDIGLEQWEMDGRLAGSEFPLTPGLAPEWISIRSDFSVEIGGDLLVPELVLDARVPEVRVLDLPLGPGNIRGSVVGERFEGSGELDSGAASFQMAGLVPLGIDGAGTVLVREVDVAPMLLADAAERGIAIVASGEGAFHIESPHDEWMTGSATLARLEVTGADFAAETTGPTRVVLEDARVTVAGLELAESESRLRVSGSIGLDDELLDLSVEGRTALAAAEPFLPGLSAEGIFDLDAEVAGPWSGPEVLGEGTIRSGAVRLEGFPHALEQVDGRIRFDQRTLRIAEVSGRLASGDAVISGSVAVEDAEIGAMDLRVQLTDSGFRFPRDLSATVDADLRVVGDRGGRLLSGVVRLDEAVWSREYELFSNLLADVNSVTGPGESELGGFLDDLRMDVRVETGSPFSVRNSLFRLEAAADFGLHGTAGAPAVLGRADLVGGEVYFGVHRFQVVSGRADFIDPEGIEPVFDIEWETNVRSYRVRLRASGTAEQIQANLSSDPPLREADILRLLSGAPEQELLTAASDDPVAAASAASLLSQQLSNMIGRRAGRVFGIERLIIDPFLIGRFSNPTARVTLGKQVSEDLNVRYSSALSAAEESIIVVEYTPQGPVSWIFSRDQDGSLGVDVRFHRSF